MSSDINQAPEVMKSDIHQANNDLPTSKQFKEKFIESNAGDGTTVYDQYLHGLPLFMSLISCFATLFLIGLDQTIVITILTEVGNQFNAYDKIGWISSGYMLTMAVFAATWGKISIIFGRKWAVLVALLLFEAGSLMCALSPNANVLIGGRVLAGIGGGGIQTLVFVICSELTPINQRPLVFVVLGLSFAFSSVSGPLIGGAFTINTTWRWCFYINLPIGGLAALFLIIFFKPPKAQGSIREKLHLIDYFGNFLLIAGVVLTLLGLTFGGTQFPWKSGAVISCFILGGVITILFCIWNFKYSKNPIIPITIIKVRQIVFPVLTIFITFYCFMGSAIYITTYFQVILGYSAWKTGVHLIPMILPVVISSTFAGILIKKTRLIKPYAIFGSICGSVGFGCLTLLKIDSSNSAKIGLLILPGVFSGITLQTAMISSQLHAPKEDGSTILATAFLSFGRALGGVIGSDLSQTIFNATFKNRIGQLLKNTTDRSLSGLTAAEATKIIAKPGLIKNLSPEVKAAVFNIVMKSIKNVFIVATALSGLSFLSVCFYSNKRIPKSEDIAKKDEVEASEGHDGEEKELVSTLEDAPNGINNIESPTVSNNETV